MLLFVLVAYHEKACVRSIIKSPSINRSKIHISHFCTYILTVSLSMLVCVQDSYAQEKTKKQTEISIHSEDNQVIDATTDPPTQFLNGNVKVYHSNTFIYSDNAVLRGPDLKMYFNVALLQNDTIRLFADSLTYNADTQIAFLYGDIIMENGPNKKLYTSFLTYDVQNKIATYTQNAKIVDEKSTLISKRGIYKVNEKKAYFYENVHITGENFDIISDSLAYQTDRKIATFLAPVRIHKDTSDVYSESGWFDVQNESGDFIGNAQYIENETIAKADTITYDSGKDIVELKSKGKQSEYISKKDTAYAETIFYDKKNETFKLTTDAYYKGENNEVKGDKVNYDKKTEKFDVTGRSRVSDPPSIIQADTLFYDKSSKYGIAHGKVIWQDTTAKTTIYADHMVYNGEQNDMKAHNDVGKPMFSTDIDGDTLYLKADTLRSFRIIKERIIAPDANAIRKAKLQASENKTQIDSLQQWVGKAPKDGLTDVKASSDTLQYDNIITPDSTAIPSGLALQVQMDTIFTGIMDTIDYFIGDNHVKLYKSDMQGVCDSLVFNKSDSIFTLMRDPYVWSDSSQIAGDTIDILMKLKKVDKLIVRSNASIISSEDLVFFNQIKGRFLEAFFEESKIYRMDIDGNAQIVYYLTDKEKAYTGVNTTESSSMSFFLTDNKITDIRCYKEPKSKVIPMGKADHEALKVKGFKWNADARPLQLSDL